MAAVYGAVTAPAGQTRGSEHALRVPDGCVPVRQLYNGEEAGNGDIVPAPPATNRDAVNVKICSLEGCRGKRKRGTHLCAPHVVAEENRKAALNGNPTAD